MDAGTGNTSADRYALDNTRETEEMLARLGKFTTEEIVESQVLRASVGAKPLGLNDARVFDASTLTAPLAFAAEDVKELREREGASQAVMAAYLGVATKTLGQWERGERKPEGPAAKLLSLVKAHGLSYIKG